MLKKKALEWLSTYSLCESEESHNLVQQRRSALNLSKVVRRSGQHCVSLLARFVSSEALRSDQLFGSFGELEGPLLQLLRLGLQLSMLVQQQLCTGRRVSCNKNIYSTAVLSETTKFMGL